MMKLKQLDTSFDTPQPPRYLVAGLLALITLAAAWLRFTDLGTKSLWTDEYWQALFLYTFRLDELLRVTLFREWEPPLIYLLSYPLVQVFGLNEFMVRLPCCLAGIATVPMAYLLGKEVAGKRVGLFSAFIFTIHPTAFWYSQDARPYGLLIFCTTLALWLYARTVRKTKFSPSFMLGMIALAISHYFAVVPGMFLLAIDLFKQVFKKTSRSWSALFWEYLPYVLISSVLIYLRLSNFNLSPDIYTGPQPVIDINNWELIYANLVFGYRRLHVLAWVLAAIGMILMLRRRQEITWHFILGGSIGTAALMLLCVYIFRFRYFYYLIPQMVLFIALALNWLLDLILSVFKLKAKIWKAAGSFMLAGLLMWWCYEPLTARIHGEKMDYRTLADLYYQELGHLGVILIPLGDFGLTTYPPYCHGAITNTLISNKPEEAYAVRVAHHIDLNVRGMALFPTAEQMQFFLTDISSNPFPPRSRLYVHGFHVLIWDKQFKDDRVILKWIDKVFHNQSPLNIAMSKAYFYEDRQEWEDALKCIDQAMQLNPDSSEAYATEGRILRKMGKNIEAGKAERRAWLIDVLLKNSTYVD